MGNSNFDLKSEFNGNKQVAGKMQNHIFFFSVLTTTFI